MSELIAPAETYTLNTLASILGRFAVADPSRETLEQAEEMLGSCVDDLSTNDTPPFPHTDSTLLTEAAKFDEKLIRQVQNGPAKDYLSTGKVHALVDILETHQAECLDTSGSQANWEMLAKPGRIADAYGLPDLWSNSSEIISEEIAKWGKSTQHPATPAYLNEHVSLDETRSLLSLMWERVIEVAQPPQVHTYLTNEPQNYHVFWAPVADKLDYATPASYDRATQLSFDLPHNATHLAHLALLDPTAGTKRYDDSMALRAYFEAATVLSEYKTIEVATEDPGFGAEVAKIYGIYDEPAASSLSRWIEHDRRYEFKLRAARYAADVLLSTGMPYSEAVVEISGQFGIPVEDADKETRKYLPWTGLGAVYSFGYRKLLEQGIGKVSEALCNNAGDAIQTWRDYAK